MKKTYLKAPALGPYTTQEAIELAMLVHEHVISKPNASDVELEADIVGIADLFESARNLRWNNKLANLKRM